MNGLSASDFRKKGMHIVLGNRLLKDGKKDEAATHFREAAKLEDLVLGKMIAEERDDWVVNAVSLLWCWRKSGDAEEEARAAKACKALLETMPVADSFKSFADEIRNWQ